MGQRKKGKENCKMCKLYENTNTTYQYLWYTTKALIRERFIALSAHIIE